MFVHARKNLKRSRGLAALVLAGLLFLGPEAIGGGNMSVGDDEMVGTLPCSIPLVLPAAEGEPGATWDVPSGLYLEGSNRAISNALVGRRGTGVIYQESLGNGRSRLTLVGEVELQLSESLFDVCDLELGIQTNFETDAVVGKVARKSLVTSTFLIDPDTDYELPTLELLRRGVFDFPVEIYTFSTLHGRTELQFHSYGGMLNLSQR